MRRYSTQRQREGTSEVKKSDQCEAQRTRWHELQWGTLAGDPELVWHRKCYSDFTHKGKIKRLTETVQSDNTSKRRRESSEGMLSGVSTSEDCSTRRSTQPVNWDLCMFCQEPDGKQRLISVSTFNVSKNILELSKLDNKMRFRLAGVKDLIAAEGKYHQNCRNDYSFNTSKTKRIREHWHCLYIPVQWAPVCCRKITGSSIIGRLAEISGHCCWNRDIHSSVVFQS